MSLNTAHANGGVLIHAGECILLFSDAVSIEFHGHPENVFRGGKCGRLYLTTHRMIFNNKNQQDGLVSFSFPFVTLSDLELEQPVFGANFIKGKVRAQPNGNWVGEVKFRLTFKKGGAIDFGQAMLKAAHMASRSGTTADAPPPYAPPPGPWYAAPPPAYAPPPGGYYGWVPEAQAFPNAPPGGSSPQTFYVKTMDVPQANSVYMTDSPPPYPGINGYNGYAQAPQNGNGATGFTQQPMPPADAKAAEAAQSAYYDPSKPQCAYVPPPAYYEPPPSYQETKKDQ